MARQKAKAAFITGTDTGVGKTVITGLLARSLLEEGYSVITQKWIQTGTASLGDIGEHLRLMNTAREEIEEYLPFMLPYNFKYAASPHLACAREKIRIGPAKIKKGFRALSKAFDFVIIEGTGGALVPFNKRRLVIDIAKELKLPVLIVSGNRLGAINHTLLTVEAVRERGMDIIGVVFNNIENNTKSAILKDNAGIVERLTGERALGILRWARSEKALYEAFRPIAGKITRALKGVKEA